MVLAGDPGQLHPVGGTPLYGKSDKSFCLQGELAYSAFTKVVILDQVVRQQVDHNDPRQALFLQLLLDLHEGINSKSQWELLMTCTHANIGVSSECGSRTR